MVISDGDLTGKGYVWVYRTNEGPSRNQCLIVFNATGVYSPTGGVYKWNNGVVFLTATNTQHSKEKVRKREREIEGEVWKRFWERDIRGSLEEILGRFLLTFFSK